MKPISNLSPSLPSASLVPVIPASSIDIFITGLYIKPDKNLAAPQPLPRETPARASYRAFRAVNVFCPFLWLALLLLSYVFPIGLLPMVSVLAVWAVLEVTYILECIRLSKRTGEV